MPQALLDSNVNVVVERFRKIEQLRAEAQALLAKIQDIYAQMGAVAGGTGKTRGRPRSVATLGTGEKRRGKRGALKAAIHKVLANGKPHTTAEVVKQLPKAGYKPHSVPRVLYNAVYLTLGKDKAIKKTPEGFKLQAKK